MYPPDNWTNVNWSIAQLQFVQLEIWSIVTLFNNFLINWFLLDCWFDHLTYVQSVFWSIDFCSVSFLLNCFVQLFLFNLVLVNRHGRVIWTGNTSPFSSHPLIPSVLPSSPLIAPFAAGFNMGREETLEIGVHRTDHLRRAAHHRERGESAGNAETPQLMTLA